MLSNIVTAKPKRMLPICYAGIWFGSILFEIVRLLTVAQEVFSALQLDIFGKFDVNTVSHLWACLVNQDILYYLCCVF